MFVILEANVDLCFVVYIFNSAKAEICLPLCDAEELGAKYCARRSFYLIYFALSSACAYAMLFGTFSNA